MPLLMAVSEELAEGETEVMAPLPQVSPPQLILEAVAEAVTEAAVQETAAPAVRASASFGGGIKI